MKSKISILVFLLFITGCDSPKGTDYEQKLYVGSDGLVKLKGTDDLYSGEAYVSVCSECFEPFLNSYPVHSVENYRNGKKHGVSWHPKSGRSDDYFDYKERHKQKSVKYSNGKMQYDKNP
ncbi:hypothetical protein A9Q78_03790 [Methylophaga sp. 41_12_T18]|nr:hypothetical protein A9Q78_03790 [Methylophaga sp. 41_12_T18]